MPSSAARSSIANQPVGVDDVAERKDDTGDDRRPDELARKLREGRRAGIAAGRDLPLSCWLRTPNGRTGEQHQSPDDEVDREPVAIDMNWLP